MAISSCSDCKCCNVPRQQQCDLANRLIAHSAVDAAHSLAPYKCCAHVSTDNSHVCSSGGYAGRETSADADHDDDAVGVSTGLSLLPHCLADLSRLLGARLDPYAIGPVSLAVAKGLAVLPQGPRGGTIGDVLADGLGPGSTGAARHHAFPRPHMEAPAAEAGGTSGTVGLVLIDRSLDLATPCMHGDHVLDGIFAHLPRAAEVVWSESGPSTAGTPRGRQRVGLR